MAEGDEGAARRQTHHLPDVPQLWQGSAHHTEKPLLHHHGPRHCQEHLQFIPTTLKGKVAHLNLREQQKEQKDGAVVQVAPAAGGRNLPVRLGAAAGPSTKKEPLTHSEIIKSSTKIHLLGAKLSSQAADLRAKLGREAVQPGLQKGIPEDNQRLKAFFTIEERVFHEKEKEVVKPVFFCSNSVTLIKEVTQLWGNVEVVISLSIIPESDLEHKLTGAGFYFVQEEVVNGPGPSKRAKRSTGAKGISGGQDFKDWGTHKMILLVLVRKVTESHYNLQILLNAIGADTFPFKIPG